ncbi:MAG: DNA-3-methyladenine glycosylase [Sphingobacteriales bacterium]|nr:MAG: DNA-3-methyladenine glycosylase [Sphingobacteriales bacterium]
MGKLPISYYQQDDVVALSRDLLGKYLFTNINDEGLTGGIIVETEAYAGATDKASHAHMNRFTNRTKIMYEAGGVAYVYLIYGFYYLLNFVTNIQGIPHAVLIRAIEPSDGIPLMLKRRKIETLLPKITAGPGVLTQALGIDKTHNGMDLTGDTIWVEDRGLSYPDEEIIASPRVNVAYAKEDALLPWRFRVKGNKYTSPAK